MGTHQAEIARLTRELEFFKRDGYPSLRIHSLTSPSNSLMLVC
jgi:hypothetical protein